MSKLLTVAQKRIVLVLVKKQGVAPFPLLFNHLLPTRTHPHGVLALVGELRNSLFGVTGLHPARPLWTVHKESCHSSGVHVGTRSEISSGWLDLIHIFGKEKEKQRRRDFLVLDQK